MANHTPAPADGADVRTHVNPMAVASGDWFWVISSADAQEPADDDSGLVIEGASRDLMPHDESTEPGPPSGRPGWLGCVMHVGSNYVLLQSPPRDRGSRSIRVHFDNFWTRLEKEPDPERVIQRYQRASQQDVKTTLKRIEELTMRLGLHQTPGIRHSPQSGDGALMVLSSTPDVNEHKAELLALRDQQLPELHKQLKEEHHTLAQWLGALSLPLHAQVKDMKSTVAEIDGRVFTLGLYAGLVESVQLVREGKPASIDTKLHVMQQRLYMDEECLVNYRHGGMEFKHIAQFDAWLCDAENFERLLPFPRCIVAMRVRRHAKERGSDWSLRTALINFNLEQQDKLTFLYIRNGEQLHRLDTEIEFGDQLFPGKNEFDPGEPSMYLWRFNKIEGRMSVADYESRLHAKAEIERAYKEWAAANPGENNWMDNPHRHSDPFGYNSASDWHRFDPSSVYYDDIAAHLSAEIQQYNRIAVLIQGLFDRSEVLHPHPRVQTWTASGFDAAITLVYDATDVLENGEAPDFEAYRARCNASLGEGSVVIGQELVWLRAEGEKETTRRQNDYRRGDDRWRELETYRPYGNPGPGYMTRIARWQPRAKKAVFSWERERQRVVWPGDDTPVRCTITVESKDLFNVSAYKLGDFKQFFQDRRTRAQYLKWAPMLLAAEEHHGALAAKASDAGAT